MARDHASTFGKLKGNNAKAGAKPQTPWRSAKVKSFPTKYVSPKVSQVMQNCKVAVVVVVVVPFCAGSIVSRCFHGMLLFYSLCVCVLILLLHLSLSNDSLQ